MGIALFSDAQMRFENCGGSITFAGDGTCSLHQKRRSHCTDYWNVSLGIALKIQRLKNTDVTQLSWASGLQLEPCF